MALKGLDGLADDIYRSALTIQSGSTAQISLIHFFATRYGRCRGHERCLFTFFFDAVVVVELCGKHFSAAVAGLGRFNHRFTLRAK